MRGICRDGGRTTQKGYVEILEFTHFVEFFSFNRIAENHKEKELVRKVTVVVALDLGCGNTKNSEYESKYTTKFTIKVNARTISADATNFNNFAKSTVTHEFGHVFWLCG